MSEAARNSSDGTSALWFLDVHLCGAALRSLDAGIGLLPAADCTHIEDTTPELARGTRFTAHRALRAILAATFGPHWRDVALVQRPHRKPGLPGLPGDFSLSHSGNGALIGVTRGRAIGVDLERPRSVRISAQRCARIEEAAVTLAAGAPLSGDGDARTLNAWVRLEATAKADGCGMARLLTRIGALGGSPSPDAFFAMRDALRAHDVVMPVEYVGAVALAAGDTPPCVQLLPTDIDALRALINGRRCL